MKVEKERSTRVRRILTRVVQAKMKKERAKELHKAAQVTLVQALVAGLAVLKST